jgi:hypothetical protein
MQQLFSPVPRKFEVLTSLVEKSGLLRCGLRERGPNATPPSRKARLTNDESMIKFARRPGGRRTLEDRNILALMIACKSRESPRTH